MELFIKDRIYLPALLPKKGTFQEFNLKEGLLKKIAISEQERQEIELREDDQTKNIEWNTEKDTGLYVDFSTEELEYLCRSFEKLSQEELPDDMWMTVRKIYDSQTEPEN